MSTVSHYKYGNHIITSQVNLQPLPLTDPQEQSLAFSFEVHAPTNKSRFETVTWVLHIHQADETVTLSIGRDQALYLLQFPLLATFQVSPARRTIECFPVEILPPHTLTHLLLDQVLPRLISHLGGICLHASAVLIQDAVIMFCGESGWGKSTLAHSFDQNNYPAFSDDVIIIEQGAAGMYACAPYAGLRLWPETMSGMASRDSATTLVSHYNPKARVASQANVSGGPAPLKAIFLLGDPNANTSTINIRPVAPSEAVMVLVRARFRLDIEDREALQQELEQFSTLVETIPFYQLDYPRRFGQLAHVRQALLRQLGQEA